MILRNLLHYVYLQAKLMAPVPSSWELTGRGSPDGGKGVRAAFLCDEMTWQDFQGCCDCIFLHPKLWREQLRQFSPDILFCEAAWSGIERFPNVWRGRVYRDRRLSFDNRKVLRHILSECARRGIPTVFWNKEDPTYFRHPIYDFTDTALAFDMVFTTAQECIPDYQALGQQRVGLLPFGVNTELFSLEGYTPRPNTAIFAGSWFGDHPERCAALEQMLDYALERGWALDIYDRKSDSPEQRFRFPPKYRPYIRPAVPYREMAAIYKRYAYAINVNTVVDSASMCSRRLLQLAACGPVVLSNDSAALAGMSDCLETWPAGKDGLIFARGRPEAIRQRYDTRRQFAAVLEQVGLPVEAPYAASGV